MEFIDARELLQAYQLADAEIERLSCALDEAHREKARLGPLVRNVLTEYGAVLHEGRSFRLADGEVVSEQLHPRRHGPPVVAGRVPRRRGERHENNDVW